MLIVLAVAALAFLPGALALRCAGVSWRWALALGPAVSLLLAEVLATVYYKAGLPYNRVSALVGVLAVLCVIVLARIATRRRPVREYSDVAARPRSPVPWWVYFGAAVGAVLLAVPLVAVMGSGSALLQQWDGVYHLSAIRVVREYQTASSLWGMVPLYRDGSAPTFFPSAFHALVSLSPGAGVQVLNSAVYVFGVAVWAAGLVALAAVVDARLAGRLGLRRYVLPAVVVPISAAFINVPAVLFPLLSAIPFAASLVLLPAVLAGLADSRRRVRWAGAVAGAGMAVTHPINVASFVVLVLPIAAAWALAHRSWLAACVRSPRAALRSLGAVAVIALAALVYWKVSAGVRNYERKNTANPLNELIGAVIDRTPLWHASDVTVSGAVLAVLSVAGLVLIAMRGPRWFAGGVGAAWALLIVIRTFARVDVPVLQPLSAFWYSQAARVAPVATIISALLAAVAISYFLRSATWVRVVAVGIAFGVLTAGWRGAARAELTAAAYEPGRIAWGTMADADDMAVLDWLKRHGLPGEGALFGDPANGAAFAYGYSGVDSVVRHLSVSSLPQYAVTALSDLADNPGEQCQNLVANGVRYVYLDSDTAADGAKVGEFSGGMYGVETSNWTLVTEHGSVSVWQLPESCS